MKIRPDLAGFDKGALAPKPENVSVDPAKVGLHLAMLKSCSNERPAAVEFDFEAQMAAAREVMKRRKAALRELAK